MFFALCVKTVQGASLVATRGDGGHETGVSRKPGAGHLLCASSVDPRPPDAGSCWRQWRAWDDFLLLERELACIQERQMRLGQKGQPGTGSKLFYIKLLAMICPSDHPPPRKEPSKRVLH
jgi:hypothetical protein